MSVVPDWALRVLGISRTHANRLGVVGCGIQLTETGEYDYGSLTVTLKSSENLFCFLTVERIPFDYLKTRYIRLELTQVEEYIKYSESIKEFLDRWMKVKAKRLGPKALLPPWELDSQDHFIIMLDDESFSRHFISDPRERLSHAELLRGNSLHKPLMKTVPEGYPQVPRAGGWIRPCSIAKKE